MSRVKKERREIGRHGLLKIASRNELSSDEFVHFVARMAEIV